MAFYRHVRAATNGFETNDVIEDWRHWLRSVAPQGQHWPSQSEANRKSCRPLNLDINSSIPRNKLQTWTQAYFLITIEIW